MATEPRADTGPRHPKFQEAVNHSWDEEYIRLSNQRKELQKEYNNLGDETKQTLANLDARHNEENHRLDTQREAIQQKITMLEESLRIVKDSLRLALEELDANRNSRASEDNNHKAEVRGANTRQARRIEEISTNIVATKARMRDRKIEYAKRLQQDLEHYIQGNLVESDDEDAQAFIPDTQQPSPASDTPPPSQGYDGFLGSQPRSNRDEGPQTLVAQVGEEMERRLNDQVAQEGGIQQPIPLAVCATPLASPTEYHYSNASGNAPATSSASSQNHQLTTTNRDHSTTPTGPAEGSIMRQPPVTWDELYQLLESNGIRHRIFQLPNPTLQEGHVFYILNCDKHNRAFEENLHAAWEHLSEHELPPLSVDDARAEVYRLFARQVSNCTVARMEQYNGEVSDMVLASSQSPHPFAEGYSPRFQFEGVSNPNLVNIYRALSPRTKMWHAVLVLTWDIARTKTPLGTIPPPECVINFTSWRPGYEDNGPLVEKRLFPVLYLSEKVPIPTGSEIFTIPEEGEHFDWIPVSNLRVLDLSSPEQENDVGRAEAMALLTFWCPLQRRLATEGSQVTARGEILPTPPIHREFPPHSSEGAEWPATPLGPSCYHQGWYTPLQVPENSVCSEITAGPTGPYPHRGVPSPSTLTVPNSVQVDRSYSPSTIVVAPLDSPPCVSTPTTNSRSQGSPAGSTSANDAVAGTDIKGEPGDLKQNAHSTLCKRSRGGTETDDTGVSLSPNKRAKGRESTMTVQYADVYRNGATRHKIYPGPGRPASQDWYIFICRIHLVTFRQKDPIEQMLDHAKQQHGAACWNENESSTQWARCARLFGVSVLGCDNELAERNNAALSLSERSQSLHNRNLVESDMAILKDIQNIPLDSPGGILGVSQNNPIVLE